MKVENEKNKIDWIHIRIKILWVKKIIFIYIEKKKIF